MQAGIINLYKEKGYTSSDAVAKLRGILHYRKIGHTGTLDPDAEGVLPLCIGSATKVCELLTAEEKEYAAVMQLGLVTDTQDAGGTVLIRREVSCSEEEVAAAARSFVGGYDQLPPMYSAKKINGKKLYEYARDGVQIERKPVHVIIREIVLEDISLPFVSLRVRCSRGTYIRTLCHDIGEKLGTGACMTKLVRTQVGRFTADEAVTFDEIREAAGAGEIGRILTPVDHLFLSHPGLAACEEADLYLYNGNWLGPEHLHATSAGTDETAYRVYDSKGIFQALYRYDAGKKLYRPLKMFPADRN